MDRVLNLTQVVTNSEFYLVQEIYQLQFLTYYTTPSSSYALLLITPYSVLPYGTPYFHTVPLSYFPKKNDTQYDTLLK